VALGHTILTIAYHVPTEQTNYQDLGPTYFDQLDQQRTQGSPTRNELDRDLSYAPGAQRCCHGAGLARGYICERPTRSAIAARLSSPTNHWNGRWLDPQDGNGVCDLDLGAFEAGDHENIWRVRATRSFGIRHILRAWHSLAHTGSPLLFVGLLVVQGQ
jgi:hypothetical protein